MNPADVTDYEAFKNTVCGQIESTDYFKAQKTDEEKYLIYEGCSYSILDAARDIKEEEFLYVSLNRLLDEKALEYGVTRDE